jgi:hypothetical protein
MLFMIIETFRDKNLIAERFTRYGRMVPEGVTYHASWIDAAGSRCFQMMEAPNREAIEEWTGRWNDLIDFEVNPVLTSADFWAKAQRE